VKRTCSVILAILYFYYVVGATIHRHYCMGELVGSSLLRSNNNACEKCGMEKNTGKDNGCCKEVSIVINPGHAHTFSQTIHSFSFSPFGIPLISPGIPGSGVHIPGKKATKIFWADSPPLINNPLFLQYRNFRI
jgi:hypothetical protein